MEHFKQIVFINDSRACLYAFLMDMEGIDLAGSGQAQAQDPGQLDSALLFNKGQTGQPTANHRRIGVRLTTDLRQTYDDMTTTDDTPYARRLLLYT